MEAGEGSERGGPTLQDGEQVRRRQLVNARPLWSCTSINCSPFPSGQVTLAQWAVNQQARKGATVLGKLSPAEDAECSKRCKNSSGATIDHHSSGAV